MKKEEITAAILNAIHLLQNGQSGRAEFELGHLLVSNPGSVVVLTALADYYYQNRKMVQAAAYASRAAALITSETDAGDILYVARMLSSVGEDELANALTMRVVDSGNYDAYERSKLSAQLLEFDLLEPALALFRTVDDAALTANDRVRYGLALLFTADIEGAQLQFHKALEASPANAMASWQLAMLGLPDGRAVRIQRLERQLEICSSEEDDFLLRFALFHEYESNADTAKAFQALQSANDSINAKMHYRADIETSLIDDYLGQLQSLEFPQHSIEGHGRPIPIFIVGLPRTGTTLLEKTVSCLADVQAVGEHLNFRKCIEHQLDLVFGSPFEIANRRFESQLDFTRLGQRYREKTHWRAAGKPYYTDKEIFNYAYTGLISKALPEALIIHIRRNPMDACFSSYKQKFGQGIYPASYELGALATYFKNYERVMAFWRKSLGPRLLEVRYEDLVLRHDETLQRIKAYCRFGETASASGPNLYKASTLSAAQVQQPIHAGNINAWAKYREYLKPLREALDAEYTAYMGAIEGVEVL